MLSRHTLSNSAMLTLIFCWACLVSSPASAAPPEYRVAGAAAQFTDTYLAAMAIVLGDAQPTDTRALELSAGALISGPRITPFVSFGPVWRWTTTNEYFLTGSFSPTIIGRSRVGDRDLGGHLHFTSALAFGRRLHRRTTIAIRIQHTSNGGLSQKNPGLDMIGITFSAATGSR